MVDFKVTIVMGTPHEETIRSTLPFRSYDLAMTFAHSAENSERVQEVIVRCHESGETRKEMYHWKRNP